MPGKMALVNYSRCRPEHCDGGVCKAVKACPRKLLVQEMPFQAPMPDPSLCRGCASCVLACPLRAMELM